MELKQLRLIRTLSIIILLSFILNLFIFSLSTGLAARSDTETPPDASMKPLEGAEKAYYNAGDTIVYYLILKNEGDLPETFSISVESEFDWDIEVSPQTGVALGPAEERSIKVTFTIPVSLPQDYYKFDIIIKSRNILAGETTIHVIVTPDGVLITAVAKPILIITPTTDQLGLVSPGETLEVKVKVNCYVISSEVYLDYEVLKILDSDYLPEKNLTITTEPERIEIKKRESFVFTFTIELPENFDKSANYTCRLRIWALAEGWEENSKPVTFNFVIFNEPENPTQINILSNPIAIAGISTLVIIGAIGAALGSNEVGKYWFLSVIFIPLYTKLHKDKILDHFTRGRVYEYIRNHLGVHYSEIKRELDLNNGNLTYHLHTLEREALIKSRTRGRFKVFYPMDVKIPQDMEPEISSIRKEILDIIREHPGISQKELGLLLPSKKQRTISYHIKNMSREGVIKLEKDGRETRCYITEEVIEVKELKDSTDYVKEDANSTKYLDDDVVFRQI